METVELIGSVLNKVWEGIEMPLNYFYGSPLAISNTLGKIKDASAKYPCVVVFDEFQETIDNNPVSLYDREADVTMFFMNVANRNWSDADHINYCISSMSLLVDMFKDEINQDSRFGRIETSYKVNRTLWGLYIQGEGGKKPVFPDPLSGVEFKVVLRIKKTNC